MVKTDLNTQAKIFQDTWLSVRSPAYTIQAYTWSQGSSTDASVEEGVLDRQSVEVRCLAQTALQIPISAGSSLGQKGLGQGFLHKGVSLHTPRTWLNYESFVRPVLTHDTQ